MSGYQTSPLGISANGREEKQNMEKGDVCRLIQRSIIPSSVELEAPEAIRRRSDHGEQQKHGRDKKNSTEMAINHTHTHTHTHTHKLKKLPHSQNVLTAIETEG